MTTRMHWQKKGRQGRFAILLATLVWTLARMTYGQCTSNASSCVNCHESQGLRPVLNSADAWHVDHGFGDLCASCHAGDAAATTKETAHRGLRSPLANPSVSCAACHASDATARADGYIARLSNAAPPGPTPPTPPTHSNASGPTESGTTANRFLAAISLILGMILLWVIRREWERQKSVGDHRELPPPRAPGRGLLRAKEWSPYLAGAMLGLVVAFSEIVCGRPLAAAGAFDKLAAYPGRWLFPTSQYYAHIMSPGITWQVWLIAGVIAGSFLASHLSGEARIRWLPDTQWQTRFGPNRKRRLKLAFFGAMLVQIGAGIAGGCTSGLAISGGATLGPAAFLFMAGMFAGGIPTAWLWYRKRDP